MKITLWGVRGSLPTPISGLDMEQKIKAALELAKPGDISSPEAIDAFVNTLPFPIRFTYGGNTTCLEIESDIGDTFILDCGSGVKNLGKKLLTTDFGKGKGVASMIFSHTHWDHIHGIPFFVPFYIKGNIFNIYSPFKNMKERLEYQQDAEHFPVTLDYMKSTKNFYYIEPEEYFYINEVKILSKLMPHPGGAYGYRFEENGRIFIYTSDCEFNLTSIDEIEKYQSFFQDADVVVFDTQYTFEESIDGKLEYGHSSASIAIDIAAKFNIKHLILFHHEPDYDDQKLENVLSKAKWYLNMNAARLGNLKVDIAYEGMEIIL